MSTTTAHAAPSRSLVALSAMYALLGYASFYGSFGLYIARVWGLLESVPLTSSWWAAGAVDFALIAGFAVQHSVMARPAFKAQWTRVVPPHLERSTFVLASSAILTAVALLWQPVTGSVWSVAGLAAIPLYALSSAGWLLVAGASFAIDHWGLFGLRQVWSWATASSGKPMAFKTPGPYRAVRHPLMLGMLVGMWASPTMDGTTLLLASLLTVYVVAGIRVEEKDLRAELGDEYDDYARRVPALIPRLSVGRTSSRTTASAR